MIFNRQRGTHVSLADFQKFVARARRALRLPKGSFAVSLVTNAQITEWNRCYRGKNGPTDVLSFPIESARKRGGRLRFLRGLARVLPREAFVL